MLQSRLDLSRISILPHFTSTYSGGIIQINFYNRFQNTVNAILFHGKICFTNTYPFSHLQYIPVRVSGFSSVAFLSMYLFLIVHLGQTFKEYYWRHFCSCMCFCMFVLTFTFITENKIIEDIGSGEGNYSTE